MRIPFLHPRDVSVPTRSHWHEGTELLGYWSTGDSYIFRGNDGHTFCISAHHLKKCAAGKRTSSVRVVE